MSLKKTLRNIFLVSVYVLFWIYTCDLQAEVHEPFEATVIEVIDGDTVILDNSYNVRLLGIDTPEMGYKDENGQYISDPKPYARTAKRYLSDLVLNKKCWFEYDIDVKDRYNRHLLYCFSEDRSVFVNEYMLRNGLAVAYLFYFNLKYKNELIAAQKSAGDAGDGIWSLPEISTGEVEEAVGSIGTVNGRVISAYRSSRGVYLNLSEDFRTGFSVVIRNQALPFFENKRIDPEKYYSGRNIKVTGRIRKYGGTYIEPSEPGQIIVLEDADE